VAVRATAADDLLDDIDWTEDMPVPVKRRVAALRELQVGQGRIGPQAGGWVGWDMSIHGKVAAVVAEASQAGAGGRGPQTSS
jgi:hypothetical protein